MPFNENLALAGTYTIQIKSTINQITSAVDSTMISLEATVDLVVELIDPCTITQLLEWKTEPIFTVVMATTTILNLPEAFDSASATYGII